jgi:hypothetical protein
MIFEPSEDGSSMRRVTKIHNIETMPRMGA